MKPQPTFKNNSSKFPLELGESHPISPVPSIQVVSCLLVVYIAENIRFVFDTVRNTIMADLLNSFGVFHKNLVPPQQENSAQSSLRESGQSESHSAQRLPQTLEKVPITRVCLSKSAYFCC